MIVMQPYPSIYHHDHYSPRQNFIHDQHNPSDLCPQASFDQCVVNIWITISYSSYILYLYIREKNLPSPTFYFHWTSPYWFSSPRFRTHNKSMVISLICPINRWVRFRIHLIKMETHMYISFCMREPEKVEIKMNHLDFQKSNLCSMHKHMLG